MSNVKIKANASGTADFTIQAPATDSAVTMTLPESQGTLLTNAAGDVESAMTTQFGRRNLIINGAMQVAQRGTSFSSTATYTADRWKIQGNDTIASEIVSDAPDGFTSSIKMTNSNTTTSTSAYREFIQHIEGQNIANGWEHTSSTSFITLSFWAKSSLAGTYSCAIRTNDGTEQYFGSSFVLAANTWTKHTVTIPGNSGSTITNDNGSGVSLFIIPHYGTSYANASSDETWTSSWNTAVKTFPQNWANVSGATFYLTGVQLEVGSVATPFEHRSFGEELALCQRYYEKSYPVSVAPGTSGIAEGLMEFGSTSYHNNYCYQAVFFVTPKRASPTITLKSYTGLNATWNYERSGANGAVSSTGANIGPNTFNARVPVGAAWTGIYMYGHFVADAEL